MKSLAVFRSRRSGRPLFGVAALAVVLPLAAWIPAHGASPAPRPHATASAAASPKPVAAKPKFTVLDTTFYTNVDLERLGATRADLLYEYRIKALPGGWDAADQELGLPQKAAFQQLVRQMSVSPGPLVMDFETLYLKGSKATAARRLVKLRTFADWAHQAVPGKKIGFYGVLGNTAPAYLPLERSLAAHVDIQFPTLYTFGPSTSAWKAVLLKDLAENRAVSPKLPVYPYLWPQYHDMSKYPKQFMPASLWSFELQTCRQLTSGVVLWSQQVASASPGWVSVTTAFLAKLR